MQTVYDVEMGGHRLEALELGTAARHQQDGEVAITLPPDTCWAYRDEGATAD
jgi:iron(III) transport system ATP-binding protein